MKQIVKKILGLVLLLGITTQLQAVNTAGLVSYWPLDTISGDNTTPDVSSTNNLTLNNLTAANLTASPRGNAFTFTTNGLTATTPPYLGVVHTTNNQDSGLPIWRPGAYTVMMWVKATNQTAKYLFTEGSTNTGALFLIQTGNAAANNAKLDIVLRNDATTTFLNHKVSGTVVFNNAWHHIAWVDNNGTAALYVDGLLDPTNFNYTATGVFNFTTTTIGALVRTNSTPPGLGNTLNAGSFDEVSVWERALTQSEIQDAMTNGIANPVTARVPVLLTQPVSQTKNVGDSVTFSVTASETRPFTYQWFKDSVSILDATNRTYTVKNLAVTDSGTNYSVTVSNLGGSTPSTNAVVTVTPDAAPDVTAGIISYWPFDTVTNLPSYSTPDLYSKNDMLLNNMTETSLVSGQFANALTFDGSSQYVNRSGGFPISGNTAFSISMWVNGEGLSQPSRRVFAEASTNNNTPGFFIGTDPGINRFANISIINDAGAALLNKRSTTLVFDSAWHHLVWVDNNGQAKLYVDGVLDDTDFTYTRGSLTLNATAVGATLKAVANNFFTGSIDEVATWNRILNFGEIQQIRTSNIPHPVAPIPPAITKQPTNMTVFTNTAVVLAGEATGTSPLYFQWSKNGSPLPNETNASLTIASAQTTDSGSYSFSVTNEVVESPAVSSNAVLTVIVRPPFPGSLGIDFDHRGVDANTNETQPGFQSFVLTGAGGTTASTTNLYGGIEVILSSVGGVPLDTRLRATPVNGGDFTLEKIFQDLVFANQTSGQNGLAVTFKYLIPNQNYDVTVYSFDSGSVTPRHSDWYLNGVLLQTNYFCDGAILPTNDTQNTFTMRAPADANGTLTVTGLRNLDSIAQIGVFLNALKIANPPIRILSVALAGGNVQLTLDTPYAAGENKVQEKTNLNSSVWTDVSGVTTTPNGSTVQAQFAQPSGDMRFYRVTRVSP